MLRMRATLFFFAFSNAVGGACAFYAFNFKKNTLEHFKAIAQYQSGRYVSCFWLKVRTTCISTYIFFLFPNNYVFIFLHSDPLQFWLKPNRFRKRNAKKKEENRRSNVCAWIQRNSIDVANMHNNNNQ